MFAWNIQLDEMLEIWSENAVIWQNALQSNMYYKILSTDDIVVSCLMFLIRNNFLWKWFVGIGEIIALKLIDIKI